MKNHLGSYECKLCLTLHNNEVRILNAWTLKSMQKNVLSKVLLLVDLIIEREIIYSLTNCLYHMIDIMK